MRKLLVTFALLVSIVLLFAACGDKSEEKSSSTVEKDSTPNQENKEVSSDETVIRLAYNLPQDHHVAVGIEKFANNVTEKSNGKVKMQVYPSGQLLSDTEMNDSLLSGGVEIGVNSSTLWADTVPEMGVFDVPYAFTDYEAAGQALNGEFGDLLRDAMEEKGAKVLMFADYGFVQFANNKRPLKSPDDFKGLKIRSIGDIPSVMIKAYGASPVFMGGGEVYMGLQRNIVDGATSGTTAMLQRKYYEVTDYLTINNYAYLEFIVAMNKEFWDKLPSDIQNLIMEEAEEIEKWIREQAETEDIESAKELEKHGMEVYRVPEEELSLWKEKAMPAWEEFKKVAGSQGEKLLEMIDNQ